MLAFLNKLNLIFEGSLGYFGMGSCDGPIVRINGRVGWSCAENLMAGKVVIEKMQVLFWSSDKRWRLNLQR